MSNEMLASAIDVICSQLTFHWTRIIFSEQHHQQKTKKTQTNDNCTSHSIDSFKNCVSIRKNNNWKWIKPKVISRRIKSKEWRGEEKKTITLVIHNWNGFSFSIEWQLCGQFISNWKSSFAFSITKWILFLPSRKLEIMWICELCTTKLNIIRSCRCPFFCVLSLFIELLQWIQWNSQNTKKKNKKRIESARTHWMWFPCARRGQNERKQKDVYVTTNDFHLQNIHLRRNGFFFNFVSFYSYFDWCDALFSSYRFVCKLYFCSSSQENNSKRFFLQLSVSLSLLYLKTKWMLVYLSWAIEEPRNQKKKQKRFQLDWKRFFCVDFISLIIVDIDHFWFYLFVHFTLSVSRWQFLVEIFIIFNIFPIFAKTNLRHQIWHLFITHLLIDFYLS